MLRRSAHRPVVLLAATALLAAACSGSGSSSGSDGDAERAANGEEEAAAVAAEIAADLQANVAGVETEAEAACIADGLLEAFTVSQLERFNVEGPPANMFPVVNELVLECVPPERLVETFEP